MYHLVTFREESRIIRLMFPPRQLTARLADKRILNEKFVHYYFELTDSVPFQFIAGQYVSLPVSPHGDRRSYSICSEPSKTHGFELLVDITPQGLGTHFLEGLKFGDEVKVLGPLGKFVVDDAIIAKPLQFVATGSGIAPIRSMILDLLQRQVTTPMTLYMGIRHETHLFWEDEWQQLSQKFSNFKFHPVMSQPLQEWPLCRGRVTDCLSVHEQPAEAHYFLCGNAPMLADVMKLLRDRGVSDDRIHHEKFT